MKPQSPGAKAFIHRWVVTTVAVLVATNVVSGLYDNWQGLLLATLVLGLLNAFIRPLLMILSLPLLVFSLGLFTLVINALLLKFVGGLFRTFHVDTFGAAFWGALVISVVSLFLNLITGTGGVRAQVSRSDSPAKPRPRDPGDDGPVIDV